MFLLQLADHLLLAPAPPPVDRGSFLDGLRSAYLSPDVVFTSNVLAMAVFELVRSRTYRQVLLTCPEGGFLVDSRRWGRTLIVSRAARAPVPVDEVRDAPVREQR